MRTHVFPALLGAFVVLQAASAQAPEGSGTPAPVATVEGITEYRLANGLDVLLFPDNSKPTVTVNATYLVGSRHEGYGEAGMAHLLEHMLFKGTTVHPDLVGELRSHGATFNGSTSYDRTTYYETMEASEENLRWALAMEADRMVHSRVSREDLDSEMAVVRNEFEAGEDNPGRMLQERVFSTAYLWHAYGRSTVGSLSDIVHVPIERLQAFYRNYYQPDNALLVVSGKFDPARTLPWIQEIFGAIPKPTRKLIPPYTEEPAQDGEREVVLRRAGDNQIAMMAYHIPPAAHEDMAALDVLTVVLGDTPSGRLYGALVGSRKAVGASAGVYYRHDPGMLFVSVTLRKDQSLADAEEATLRVLDSIGKEPPSKEEVERARTRLVNNVELELADSTRASLALSEAAAAGDWRLLFLGRDELAKVTPADVVRVARQYLKTSNRTIGRFIPTEPAESPDRVEVPPAPDLTSRLKGYAGRADIQLGEDFDPTPANIEAHAVRATLPNGLKLVLLPKKNRGETVVATIRLHFGDAGSVRGRSTAAVMAGALLMRGSGNGTRRQLQDELSRLKAQISMTGQQTGATASIRTVRDSLVPALRLAVEALRQPAFPESEFEQIRQQRIAALEATSTEPAPLVTRAVNHHIAPYPADDPRAMPTLEESMAELQKVTLEDVQKFYADFYGASNGEIAIVGDFDPDAVRRALAEAIGDWKSPQPYAPVKKEWSRLATVARTFETPDKANAFVMAVTTFPLDDEDPEFVNLWVANQILGANPESRLFRRIRQRDGLSYSVMTAVAAGADEKFGTFTFQAISAPQNAAKVEAAFREELDKALDEGFTSQEVEEAKRTLLQDSLARLSQDAFLAATLADYQEDGRTMTWLDGLLEKLRQARPESVNAAFKKWIQPDSLSVFKGGDFGKAGN